VYDEQISKGGAGHSSSAFLGLIVAIVGIAVLAGSGAPQSSAPSPSPAT
jgi:hypothetical protein